MNKYRITLTGTAPLLMHNSRLANPLDPVSKELKKLTSKRIKTDDDHAVLARLEFGGGLYIDKDLGPYLPGDNIWRCLYDAAKKFKKGVKVKEGLLISTDVNPLAYKGPRDLSGLWADENFRLSASVRNQQNRVMRTRPMFQFWAADCTAVADPTLIELRDVEQIAETAGQIVGIGDWRPRYGRFIAKVTVIE